MRGNPLLQLVLITALFLAAGFPVWKLTHRAPVVAMTADTSLGNSAPAPAATVIELKVSLAPAPADFRLSYLGQAILEGHGPQAEFNGSLHATIPQEGADLALEAKWPPLPPTASPVPAAVRVTFKFPDGHTVERNIWGNTATPLVELITVTP